uniref:Uncharacterized protein n=1 Tax=Anguilla anguilla TaxID=7936 RepID=A0A0E9PL44_ANGAN
MKVQQPNFFLQTTKFFRGIEAHQCNHGNLVLYYFFAVLN